MNAPSAPKISPADLLRWAAAHHAETDPENALELAKKALEPEGNLCTNCYEIAALALKFAMRVLRTRNLLDLAAHSTELIDNLIRNCDNSDELLAELKQHGLDTATFWLSQLVRSQGYEIMVRRTTPSPANVNELSPYHEEASAVHKTTLADGIVLVVLNGNRGTACEVHLNPRVAPLIPDTLRTLAQAIEEDVNRTLASPTAPAN